MEEIRQRIVLISDTSAAFSDSKKYVGNLEKAYKQLSLSPKANTEPDKNWVNKLKKYQR